MDKTKALQNLLQGKATEDDIALLKHLLASGEISIGGNINQSVIILGSGNTVEITSEVLDSLEARPLLGNLERDLNGDEIALGLQRLETELNLRAPVLAAQLQEQARRLRPALKTNPNALSESARKERVEALAHVNSLCMEALDISFNAVATGETLPEYEAHCPFRGLESFRPEDSEFFFGREALTRKIVTRIQAHPFLAVLGASGSGKSSLVMAGVIPALDSDYAVFRPGAYPLDELESARGKPLIVVDQFEELFTLTRNESIREDFITRLLDESSRAQIILTLRSDFLAEVSMYRALSTEIQNHLEIVPPMDPDELRRAMEGQAGVVGLRFEADLSQQILDDVAGEPGAMPLLQHALWELWNRRHGRNLRTAEYRAFGGVKQAITNTAEKIYAECSKPEQEQVRDIFLRLTRLDEGDEGRDTRRRVPLNDLIPSGVNANSTPALLDQLANARLIVKTVNDEITEVEVAHEALIRHWERLRIWLDEDRTALRLRESVSESAKEWEKSGRHESLLNSRWVKLDEALLLSQDVRYRLTEVEQAYLNGCVALKNREQRERERRLRYTVFSSIAAAIIFLALGSFGWVKSNEATDQASTAQANADVASTARVDAEYQKLTALANENARATAQAESEVQTLQTISQKLAYKSQNLAHDQHGLSLLLAAEANNIHSDISTLGSLLYALQAKPHNLKYFHFENEDYTYAPEVIISPDNTFIAAMFDRWKTEDQKIMIWDTATGRLEFEEVFAYDELPIRHMFFSGGDDLIFITVNNQAFSLDLRSKNIQEASPAIVYLTSSPDGTFYLGRDEQGISVWNTKTFSKQSVLSLDDVEITGRGRYLISRDGNMLVIVEGYREPTQHRKISVVDLRNGRLKMAFELPSGRNFGYFDIAINHGGSILVYSISNNAPIAESTAIDIETNSILWRSTNYYRNIGFFDDETLVGNVSDQLVFINSRSGRTIRRVDSPGTGFWSNDHFSIDGTLLARPMFDAIALVGLNAEYLHGQSIAGVGENVTGLGFSQDGELFYATTADGFIVNAEPSRGKSFTALKVTGNDSGARHWAVSLDAAGGVAVTVDETYSIDCWDIKTGNLILHIDNPSGAWINSYAVQNNLIAIAYDTEVDGSSAGIVEIWSIEDGTKVDEISITPDNELYPYGSWINGILFSPDNKSLAVAVYASISIYDLQSKQFTVHTPILHSNDIHRMAYSRDGSLIVSGGSDGSVILWDTQTGAQVGKPIFVNSSDLLAISPNKDILVTGGESRSEILLWNLATGEQIGLPLEGLSYYGSPVAFNPKGDQLAVVGVNNEIIIWQLSPNILGDLACTIANRNLTTEEWPQYIGNDLPYKAVCPNLPIEP